ncbi:MFS transporter [Botrimarina mediterranea]|uniref:MFS transporter n=1 Tax=Botrimarina mediterranea TaxID=2528022 RepID=UPI00118C7E88|nr:Glycerol-3-phosphate transporter [Planctomycetes bacterium K2D]
MTGLLARLRRFYAPPTSAPRLPEPEVRARYPVYRWRAMEATFLGYAMYYLVRNNIGTVAKDMETSLLYSKSMIGDILAVTAISYGLSKFLMGSVSDRSDARKFMATGLLLSAILNFAFGASSDYYVHLSLWALNGFVQGMGWPPCGRSMGHWFSESERGLTFSIWNVSHNVGGGVAGVLAAWAVMEFGGWRFAFYAPGTVALVGAAYIFLRLRDTPQSVGLPPIEEYRNDYPLGHNAETDEVELTFRELFFDKVLLNKYVWVLALANFFAYITRYSMLDWGPTYLREVKGASLGGGGLAILAVEFGGIPSTILLGWLSDSLGGRRCMIAALCMIPVFGAFLAILFTPPGYYWIDMLMLITIGFFIYPVINLIVIAALDIVSKKAIGTAAGFIGLFGYAGRTVQAKGFGWAVDHYGAEGGAAAGWNVVLWSILVCAALAFLLLAAVWNLRTRPE